MRTSIPAEVVNRYGIGPELVPDFIALRGDPSDGLPGAPGIGAKTAAALLQKHGSLENAIAQADDERPRVAAALRETPTSCAPTGDRDAARRRACSGRRTAPPT